jgi:hypothetical protein
MHDGSEATLAAVIDFFDRGGEPDPHLDGGMRPLGLTPEETFTSDDLAAASTRRQPTPRPAAAAALLADPLGGRPHGAGLLQARARARSRPRRRPAGAHRDDVVRSARGASRERGCTDWSFGLAAADPRVERITRNVLERLSR